MSQPAPEEGFAQAGQPAAAEETRAAPSNPSDYCPVCSQPLKQRSCKLVCASCGYYMSCSDFY